MTPEEFSADVLPQVLEAWDARCFCASPAFARLVSVDAGAATLADSEILIQRLITRRFRRCGAAVEVDGQQVTPYECPQCNARCDVIWEEFSINFSRSTVRWIGGAAQPGSAKYLVGWYGHSLPARVPGFEKAQTTEEFLASLRGSEASRGR